MNAAGRLLDRLELVKPTGPGRWIARCPAHEDKSPSLSIRETDDGRVLLHDFGGCQTDDVVAAIGLSLADLFDKPLAMNVAPSHNRIPARDLLELISHEIDVALIVLASVIDRRAIDEVQCERLAAAARRIGQARDHTHGR